MNNSVVGLDIEKNVFHFYSMGVDAKVIKKKLKAKGKQKGQTRLFMMELAKSGKELRLPVQI